MKEIEIKLFSCDTLSRSGRIYPKEMMEEAINDFNKNHENGLLCHPGTEKPSILESAGVVSEIKMEDGDVFGKVLLIDNIPGKVYQNILDKMDTSSIEVTPVGYGEVEDGVVKSMNITHFNIKL